MKFEWNTLKAFLNSRLKQVEANSMFPAYGLNAVAETLEVVLDEMDKLEKLVGRAR